MCVWQYIMSIGSFIAYYVLLSQLIISNSTDNYQRHWNGCSQAAMAAPIFVIKRGVACFVFWCPSLVVVVAMSFAGNKWPISTVLEDFPELRTSLVFPLVFKSYLLGILTQCRGPSGTVGQRSGYFSTIRSQLMQYFCHTCLTFLQKKNKDNHTSRLSILKVF